MSHIILLFKLTSRYSKKLIQAVNYKAVKFQHQFVQVNPKIVAVLLNIAIIHPEINKEPKTFFLFIS